MNLDQTVAWLVKNETEKNAPADELATVLMPLFCESGQRGCSPEEAREEMRHCATAAGYEHADAAADQAYARWPTDKWNPANDPDAVSPEEEHARAVAHLRLSAIGLPGSPERQAQCRQMMRNVEEFALNFAAEGRAKWCEGWQRVVDEALG